jgi:hypothetical protein
MDGSRPRIGLLVSALGAGLLAGAVFLPWYAIGRPLGPGRSATAQLSSVSAFHIVEGLSIALLVLACLALLDAVLPLVGHAGIPAGAGASLGLLGAIAASCVVVRMVDLPAPSAPAVLSVREGAWLALAGAVAIVAGGFWPRVSMPPALVAQSHFESGWSGLSGWTPQR